MDEMRYQLMPYIYAQAKHSSENGLPMMRALFIEYPEDPGSWLIDNQYLFGSDILVAPLLEEERERAVYLPPGNWIDYQTGQSYAPGWHQIKAGAMPVVMLVKEGAVIPHIKLAQSTMDMDWSNLELRVFAESAAKAEGMVVLPSDNKMNQLQLQKSDNRFTLTQNPLQGKTKFKITHYEK
jgi:alpha-D-xyloside xylohydrolase